MAAAATADPPGYFVGRPLHYEEQQPQAMPPPAPAPAVDDHKAVNAQVPGYYARRVQPRGGEDTEHNTNSSNADAAVQHNPEPSCFAKWFGCFSGRNSSNADAAVQHNPEPSCFAKWFGCFSGRS